MRKSRRNWLPDYDSYSDGYEKAEGGWDDGGCQSPIRGTRCKEQDCSNRAVNASGLCSVHYREVVKDSM